MPCGSEDNRRSGVALAMCHRLQWFIRLYERKMYTPHSVWHTVALRKGSKKGKVFPYSLPSVGPGADPGVQAVSPQVT